MSEIKLSIDTSGLTQSHLLVIARKTTDPLAEYARLSYTPANGNHNVLFTDVDPGVYHVDYRATNDPVNSLGILLGTFVQDATNFQVTREQKFYSVAFDAEIQPDQPELTDPFLDGKTIAVVYKEGMRPLERDVEYELIAGGGIRLLNGLLFSGGEKLVVDIDYLVNQVGSLSSGMFTGFATIVNNTVLDNTYIGKHIACESPSSRLVNTLPVLTTIPEGSSFYFSTHRGSQLQTKFITQGANLIAFNGEDVNELSLGKGEYLWIEKRGTRYRVIQSHPNLQEVGMDVNGEVAMSNVLAEDGTLYDGDDYPRIWSWINTKLPAGQKIIDDLVINGGYVHPANRIGEFVVHSSLKKFRMPNTQNMFKRGHKFFNAGAFGSDTERLYDFPGGKQDDAFKSHAHAAWMGNGVAIGNRIPNYDPLDGNVNREEFITEATGNAVETRPKNTSTIFYRRI